MTIIIDDLFFEIDDLITEKLGSLWLQKIGMENYQKLLKMSKKEMYKYIDSL